MAGRNTSADLGPSDSSTRKRAELPAKKTPRRTRSRSTQRPEIASPNDWNPSYFRGKEYFIAGHYDEAFTELVQNVAECRDIDFDARKSQNSYFDHVWTSITQMGQSPHDFIRASNLQWVGAALAAQGRIDQAESRFTEMENYAAQCFPGRYNTFEGCACQGLAFLLAARGQYDEAADRYRLALTHIDENQAQIGLPPAPCVAMILVALADVELARDRPDSAQRYLKRAQQIQEAQQLLGIGPAPLDKAALHTMLAQLRVSQERSSEAFDLYLQALSMIREVREDHPLSAFCLDGLGEIDLARGRLGPSADHFQESLAVRKATLGESHRELAYSYDGLAQRRPRPRETRGRRVVLQGRYVDCGARAGAKASGLDRDRQPRPDAARPHASTRRPHAHSSAVFGNPHLAHTRVASSLCRQRLAWARKIDPTARRQSRPGDSENVDAQPRRTKGRRTGRAYEQSCTRTPLIVGAASSHQNERRIASSAATFSTLERSPGSSSKAILRIKRRRILPLRVLGSSFTN